MISFTDLFILEAVIILMAIAIILAVRHVAEHLGAKLEIIIILLNRWGRKD